MNELNLEERLNLEVSATDTRREVKEEERNVSYDNIIVDDLDLLTDEDIVMQEQEEKSDQPDTFVYDVPEGAPYLAFDRSLLRNALLQISPILGLNSKRAVSRGITLVVENDKEASIIYPNDSYYFKATIPVDTTLPEGTTIFIEYLHINKMARFMPRTIYIYLVKSPIPEGHDKYNMIFTTGHLELINTSLIGSDLKQLSYPYVETETTVKTLDAPETARKANTLGKVLKIQSDSDQKIVHIKNGITYTKAATLYSCSELDLPNVQLDPVRTAYLARACTLSKGDPIRFTSTNSETIPRYAIRYGDTVFYTNYADSKVDPKVEELFNNIPELAKIDYANFKYQLEYANSIIYSMGTLLVTVQDGTLLCSIELRNGSHSEINLNILEPLPDMANPYKINTKSLLDALSALDPTLDTKIGFKDGLVYLVNDEVKLILVTRS